MKSIGKQYLVAGFLLATLGILWLQGDERTRGLLTTTFLLSAATVIIAVPWGVALAFLVTRTDAPGRSISLAFLLAMLLVPLYLQAAGWDAGFGRQGWFSLAQESFARPWLSGLRGAVWVHALAALPWVVLFTAVALRHVDPELEELGLLDAPPWQVVMRVTLPTILPAILMSALWIAILAAGEITITDLYQVRTYAEEVYNVVPLLDDAAGESGSGASLPPGAGLVLTLLLLGTVVAGSILRRPLTEPARRPLPFPLGPARWWGTLFLAATLLVVAGVPLANLTWNAGIRVVSNGGALQRSWSAEKTVRLVAAAPWRFDEELAWTALIGTMSASGCVLLAVPLALAARRGGWQRWPAQAAIALGIAIPPPLIGLAVICALNQPDVPLLAWLYDHTILAPVLATSVRALPGTLLVSWYGLQSLSTELLDAAAVDGLDPWSRLWQVIVPLRWRTLVAAWWVAFLVAAGDLSSSILVTPPGLFTLPVRIFGLLHAGVDDQVAALCLANLGFVLVVVGIVSWLVRRFDRHRSGRGTDSSEIPISSADSPSQ